MHKSKLAIGVDIGGTRTKIGIVELVSGEVLEMIIRPTEKKDGEKFNTNLETAINELLKNTHKEKNEIVGIGIGVPGFVDENGIVDSTYGFLEFMEDYPLVNLVEKNCVLKCRIDNDARMVALGEALYGKAKAFNRVLVLTLGTGLGLGFVVNKKLEGLLPYGHMGGHMSITENDVTCYCGKQGCLEALVSASGIIEAALLINWREKYPLLPVDAETIFTSALAGNKDANEIVSSFITHLRKGIDNYINIYAPDVIVIGGGLAKGMKPYLQNFGNTNILKPFKNYKVTTMLSELDEQSGILGSAALFND